MAINVSRELLNEILNHYEKEQEILFPVDLEINDEQRRFVQGYLCAHGGVAEDNIQKMDDAIKKQILQVRSKYCEPILELLAQEGELYHGDLADKLEMTPSGLNAIIKKMQEGNTVLIETMQIGKYKIYTLPVAVKNYIKNKNGIIDNKDGKKQKREDDLLLKLQHFIESAGDRWRDKLNLLLQGEEDADEKVRNAYEEFMRQIQRTTHDNEDYIMVKEVLNNEVLFYLLDRYIDEIKECEQIMEGIGKRKNGKRLLQHFTLQ